MPEKSNKLSNDFWNLWQNVEEHSTRQRWRNQGSKSRVVCTGIGTFELKDPETRNDGQMPQVPRILQTDIVHETHLHHEKAERLAATCMQDSCKSWEALLCRVGLAVPPPRKYWNSSTPRIVYTLKTMCLHTDKWQTLLFICIYIFYILYTNLFHINLFQALPVWFTIYKKVPHTYNTSNSALLWHIVIYISDVIYCHFCWAI